MIIHISSLFHFLGKKAVLWLSIGIFGGICLSFLDLILTLILQALLNILGISNKPMVLFGYELAHISLGWFLGLLIFFGMSRSFVNFLISQSSSVTNELIGSRLRQLLFFDALKIKKGFLSLSEMNTMLGEVFPQTTAFFLYLSLFLPQAVYGLVLMVALFFIDIKLSLIGLVGVFFIGLFVKKINKKVRVSADKRPKEYQELMMRMTKVVKNFFLLRAFRTVNNEYNHLVQHSLNYSVHGLRSSLFAYIGGLAPHTLGVTLMAALIYTYVQNPYMAATQFLSFLYIFFRFLQNLGAVASSFGVVNVHYPNFKRSYSFFLNFNSQDYTSAFIGTQKLNFLGTNVKFISSYDFRENLKKQNLNSNLSSPRITASNISFSYSSHQEVLKQLSFDVLAGESLGIIGKSGSGKSTLLGIILGILNPNEGKIMIDGHTPTDYFSNPDHRIGYVGPDPFIIEGSIRENLLYASPYMSTDQECLDILKLVKLETWVNQQKTPLDYRLSEFGDGLSTGQKQRLSLARSLLRRPKLLILDEISANLDKGTEDEIAIVLESLRGFCTMVIVSHRDGILKYINQKINLDD